jgi:hypothetical protein
VSRTLPERRLKPWRGYRPTADDGSFFRKGSG